MSRVHERNIYAEIGYYRTFKEGNITGYFRNPENAKNYVEKNGGHAETSCVFLDNEAMARTFLHCFQLASDFSVKDLITRSGG